MGTPYFSIIIPTHNRGMQLVATIGGILDQSFPEFEVIIVDDGSDDNTEELVASISNAKLRYFKTANNERGQARNFGLKQARGIYVNFFDSDDIAYTDRLQKVFSWIQNNKTPSILFTHYDFINSQGNVIGHTERVYKSFTADLLFNNFLATGSVFLKREIALNHLFQTDRRIMTAEDWELWLRIHAIYDFHECPLRTFGILQHAERSLNKISVQRVKERDLYFIELVEKNGDILLKYGNQLSLFIADRYTFIALTMAENRQCFSSCRFLIKSVGSSPKVLARKRFWATLKKVLFS